MSATVATVPMPRGDIQVADVLQMVFQFIGINDRITFMSAQGVSRWWRSCTFLCGKWYVCARGCCLNGGPQRAYANDGNLIVDMRLARFGCVKPLFILSALLRVADFLHFDEFDGEIDLSMPCTTTPAVLAQAPQLPVSRLSFRDCTQVSDFSVVARCFPSVHDLDIEGTAATADGIAQFASLKHLRNLNCCNCPRLTDVSVLARIPQLESLRISFSCIDDQGVAKLRGSLHNLQHIALCGCTGITDAGFLTGCSELKAVNLGGTSVTTEGVAPLADLPKLEWVLLIGCFRLTSLRAFTRCASLRKLTAFETWIGFEEKHLMEEGRPDLVVEVRPLSLSNPSALDAASTRCFSSMCSLA